MKNIDDAPVIAAKKHLEILQKDFQDRDLALANKINATNSEIQAAQFQGQRDQLRSMYERAFSGARDEISKAEAVVSHKQQAATEEAKLAVEIEKSKIYSKLALHGVTEEEFERLWPTIHDRLITEDAVASKTTDAKNPALSFRP
jgi:hypothetical protein